MLSRRSRRSTRQLRKARSSESSSRRSEGSGVANYTDDETARHQALTAAEIAYEREYPQTRKRSPACSRSSKEAPCGLHRTQSVRFAGPTAMTGRRLSITRRQANNWGNADSRSIISNSSCNESIFRQPQTPLTAYLQRNSTASTPGSKTGSLNRARSMLEGHGGLSKYLPPENAPVPPRTSSLLQPLDADEVDHVAADNRVQKPQTTLSNMQGVVASVAEVPLDNLEEDDETCEYSMALRQQKSLPAFGGQQHPPRAFRRTVRSSSLTSYGDGVVSHAIVSDLQRKPSSIGLRMRHISSSVRGRVMRAFRKASGSSDSVPQQQVDSGKPHFGDDVQGRSEESRYPFVPMPDEETVSRCSSGACSARDLPAPFNPLLHTGSIKSMKSVDSDGLKSRVTSWANSTLSEGTKRMHPAEVKRLSVIEENGGPHQPSSSAGLVGTGSRNRRVHELFRRPLRAGAGRTNESVDSQVIFSALQQRLHEMKLLEDERRRLGDTASRNSTRQTSAQSMDSGVRTSSDDSKETTHTTVRLVSDASTIDAVADAAPPGDSDDVFLALAEPFYGSRLERSDAYMTSSPVWPQHVQNQEVPSPTGTRRRAEHGPTLWPAHQDAAPTEFSPYRKAVLAEIAEEEGRATVYNPAFIAPKVPSTSLAGQFMGNRNVPQSDSGSDYSADAGGTTMTTASSSQLGPEKLWNGERQLLAKGLGANRVVRRQKYCPSFVGSDSTSDASDEQAEDRDSAAPKATLERNGHSRSHEQHSRQGWRASRHIRERAQFHDDESDEAARQEWPNGLVPRASDRGPVAMSDNRDASLKKRVSRPLSERDASHINNVPASSATSQNESLALKELLGENRRASYQPSPPYGAKSLSQKASMASLAEQRHMGTGFASGFADGSRPGSVQAGSAMSSVSTRHSPERIARLRRLQSRSTLGSDPVRNVESSSPSKDEHSSYQTFTRPRYAGADGSILSGSREGRRTPGGSRMVEDFLSRRRDREASVQSNGPAFL